MKKIALMASAVILAAACQKTIVETTVNKPQTEPEETEELETFFYKVRAGEVKLKQIPNVVESTAIKIQEERERLEALKGEDSKKKRKSKKTQKEAKDG